MNLEFLNNDTIFLKPTPWPKLKKRAENLLERNTRFIAKVRTQIAKSEAKASRTDLLLILIIKRFQAMLQ